jgi:methyl-accepting chemotaxis protein
MNIVSGPQDRRQFGRRWGMVHGWITVDGRPRMACTVRNFSEGGALLVVEQAMTLPYTFLLDIEAIDFKIGCQARHRQDNRIGVRFISADLVSEIGPVWSIDEMMARATRGPHQSLAG